MLEVAQLVNEVQGAIQAIGGLNIVKSLSLSDYLGLPEHVLEQRNYTFHYTNGTTGLSGVCESKMNTLHCQTHLFDGNTVNTLNEVVSYTDQNVSQAVMTYGETKIKQLHIAIYPDSSQPVELVNAFHYH